MLQTYNLKFAGEVSLSEFKRSLESVVVTSSGKKCSRQKFSEERIKRAKNIIDFVKENTLSDLKLYSRVRDQLVKELAGIKYMKIDDVPRTKKIYSESQDEQVLELLNQAIGEVIQSKPVESWNDIAHMIQATQLAYEKIKFQAKVKSNWTESILKKIQTANSSSDVLIKARDSRFLPGEELKKGRKIMRELGLVLERKDDVINAISRLSEKAALYQRKLDTYVKRKEFAQVNRNYELRRGQFYRDLGGDEKASIDVEEEELDVELHRR